MARRNGETIGLESSLSEELLLRILSFLEARDLAVVSRLTKSWNRIAADQSLWKNLFQKYFPSTMVRRTSQNLNQPTPFRDDHQTQWKTLFKISIRWRSLVAKTSSVVLNPHPSITDDSSFREGAFTQSDEGGENHRFSSPKDHRTLLQHYGPFIFTARGAGAVSTHQPQDGKGKGSVESARFHQNRILVHWVEPGSSALVLIGEIDSSSSTEGNIHSKSTLSNRGWMTCLQLDEVRPSTHLDIPNDNPSLDDDEKQHRSLTTLRLGAFYQSGHFSIFKITLSESLPNHYHQQQHASLENEVERPKATLKYIEEHTHTPTIPYSCLPIVQVAFHSPILVALLNDGRLFFWTVEEQLNDSSSFGRRAQEASSSLGMRETTKTTSLTVNSSPLTNLVAPSLSMPCVLSLSPNIVTQLIPPSSESSPTPITPFSPPHQQIITQSFTLSLAYSMPSYPPPLTLSSSVSSTVVALQSFTILLSPYPSPSSNSSSRTHLKLDRDSIQFACSPPPPLISQIPSRGKSKKHNERQFRASQRRSRKRKRGDGYDSSDNNNNDDDDDYDQGRNDWTVEGGSVSGSNSNSRQREVDEILKRRRLGGDLASDVTSITMSAPYLITSHSSNVVRPYILEKQNRPHHHHHHHYSPPSLPITPPRPPASSSRNKQSPLSIHSLPLLQAHHLTSPLLSMRSSPASMRCVTGGKDGKVRVFGLGKANNTNINTNTSGGRTVGTRDDRDEILHWDEVGEGEVIEQPDGAEVESGEDEGQQESGNEEDTMKKKSEGWLSETASWMQRMNTSSSSSSSPPGKANGLDGTQGLESMTSGKGWVKEVWFDEDRIVALIEDEGARWSMVKVFSFE